MRKLRTFTAIEGLKKVENRFVNQGLTLNFGSRQSSLMIRFYQKDYEQALLKDVSVDLVKNSKWPCDGYDIRPCDGDGLLKSPIYGVYMRNVNNVTMENVHSKAQEGFPYGGEIAEK